MKNVRNDGIIKGAFFLGAGTFVSKFLGAIYRIPLTNLIGSFGLGLYQMVFPVYALLLDFSGAATPSALSKLISSADREEKDKNAYLYLQTAIRFFSVVGIIFSLLMLFFCKPLATLQGNSNAYLGYLFLSPSIFLVCLLSCFRGYFQGLMNMKPTAISQIVEQTVKVVFGLIFVYFFRQNSITAVAGATFAITLSELVALCYVFALYKRKKKGFRRTIVYDKKLFKYNCKKIIKTAFPIILTGTLIPLSQVIDSFMIVNVIGRYQQDATSLYGLLSGVALTVINLPVSICYAISAVAIPSVASCQDEKQKNKKIEKVLLLTLITSLPCAVMCYLKSPFIISLLFRSLNSENKQIAVKLLRLLSPCIVLLSVIQTENAVLIGKNRLYLPSVTLFISLFIKTIISFSLMKNPLINIYGGAIGVIACYFFASLVNLFVIFTLKVKNERKALTAWQLNS